MDEPALKFDGIALSPQKEMVRVFYKELWDHADKRLIPVIFHEGFTFRGSLGPTLVGHDQFAGYVDFVTETFGQYTTDILAMLEEGNRVGGKMRFPRFSSQGIVWSAAERPSRVVDGHADLHLRGDQGTRPFCTRRHPRPN
jgi:hypothetical protein